MAKAKITVYLPYDLFTGLKMALALDEMTMTAWFEDKVSVYVQTKRFESGISLPGLRRE